MAGQDFLSSSCLALHSETVPSLPHPRAFWRKLPAAPPLRRTLSSAQLAPGCRVEAVPHSSFPLLVLSYVDYLQLSDALSYLVSHRPDAVLLFAPLFVIGKSQALIQFVYSVLIFVLSSPCIIRTVGDRVKTLAGPLVQA